MPTERNPYPDVVIRILAVQELFARPAFVINMVRIQMRDGDSFFYDLENNARKKKSFCQNLLIFSITKLCDKTYYVGSDQKLSEKPVANLEKFVRVHTEHYSELCGGSVVSTCGSCRQPQLCGRQLRTGSSKILLGYMDIKCKNKCWPRRWQERMINKFLQEFKM